MSRRIQIGLLSGAAGDMPDCTSMRRAINAARRDSAIVEQSLRSAEHNGFSGEDKYTLLAYAALTALQEYAERCLSYAELTPVTYVVPEMGHGEAGGPLPFTGSEQLCGVPHPQAPHVTCKLKKDHPPSEMHTDAAMGVMWEVPR